MNYARLASEVMKNFLDDVKFIRADGTEYDLKVFNFKRGVDVDAFPDQEIYAMTRMFSINPLDNPGTMYDFPPQTDDQIEHASFFGRMGVIRVDPILIGKKLMFYEVEASG